MPFQRGDRVYSYEYGAHGVVTIPEELLAEIQTDDGSMYCCYNHRLELARPAKPKQVRIVSAIFLREKA